MKKLPLALVALVAAAPSLAFAQINHGLLDGFFDSVINFLSNTVITLIMAVAILVFIWGVFKTFILGGHDTEKQEEGKKLMLYAIIGFVIIVSFQGIVNLIATGLGFQNQSINNVPDLPTQNR